MKLSRRDFLIKGTALFATIGIGGPLLFAKNGIFANSEETQQADVDSPVLVVIQLSGGNDGINTLIPYGTGAYFDARPTLAYKQSEVLTLNGQVGLHPSLKQLHTLFGDGKLAVIQGVGYPKPDHSHFRSQEIWQTAEPEKWVPTGWLARYVESSLPKINNPLKAIQVGNSPNKSFNSETVNVPVIQSLETFNLFDVKKPTLEKNRLAKAFMDMYGIDGQMEQLRVTCGRGADAYHSVEAIQSLSAGYQKKVEYPNTNFSRDLQLVSKLLAGKSGTRVFYVQLGGFDDHALEREQHARLLKELDEGLGAFYKDLEAQGLGERVVTMAYSEFGRRVKENGSGGTDHGTAAPVFVLGSRVKGGLYGAYPSLTNLDSGDLKYEVDFRSIYYSIVDGWLKGDAVSVLGKAYEKLAFV
jgi:uncharacterized protein (DUF1501 family)